MSALEKTQEQPDSRSSAAALAYARRGWEIIPVRWPRGEHCSCPERAKCQSPGKHPLTRHGLLEASTNRKDIERWLRKWPKANFAVATGAASGLVVLDVDPRNGGAESLAQLQRENGRLPDTAISYTGGDGIHVFLAHPGGVVRSRLVAPGLDLKADGGYVILPPSRHVSGQLYEWPFPGWPDHWPLAPVPVWLLETIQERGTGASTATHQTRILEGRRNPTLASLAGVMRRAGLGQAAIEAALLEENSARCDPPLSAEETRGIAASIARYPSPRSPDRHAEAVLEELNLSLEPGPLEWVIEEMIPKALTIRYGEGGAGKSIFSMVEAVHVAMGWSFLGHEVEQGPILWIDCEMGADDVGRLLWRVSRGLGLDRPPSGIHVFHTFDSLLAVFSQVEAAVRQYRPILGYVDSFGAALGGLDSNLAHNINPLMSRTQGLDVPFVLIDHQAKLQKGESYTDKKPFGSVYKFNRARSVQQVEVEAKEYRRPGQLGLLLLHVKSNWGPLPSDPLAVSLSFSPNKIEMAEVSVGAMPGLVEKLPKQERVYRQVVGGARFAADIARALETTPSATRGHLNRLLQRGRLRKVETAGQNQPDEWYPADEPPERPLESGAQGSFALKGTNGERPHSGARKRTTPNGPRTTKANDPQTEDF